MLRWVLVFAIVLIGLLALVLVPRFRNDLAAAEARLAAEGPDIAETACGPVEFVDFGDGPAVLVVHGIFGGFDQGLGIAKGNLPPGYRAIVPSRFGYLGTPLPTDATPDAQADAFACLLDSLGVERVVLHGTSAGSTATLLFALRYPERTAGLILMAPNAPGGVEVGAMPRPIASRLFRSEVVFWLLTTRMQSALAPIMGVPEGFELTPEQATEVAEMMRSILPVRPRADGVLFDMYVSNPHVNEPIAFGSIDAPALVINARDDPLALYRNTAVLADRLPNAKLLSIADGGHLLLGHGDEVKAAVGDFLDRVAPR